MGGLLPAIWLLSVALIGFLLVRPAFRREPPGFVGSALLLVLVTLYGLSAVLLGAPVASIFHIMIWPISGAIFVAALIGSPLHVWSTLFFGGLLAALTGLFLARNKRHHLAVHWLLPCGLAVALVVLPCAGQAIWSSRQMAASAERLGLNCIMAKPLLASVRLAVEDQLSFDPLPWPHHHALSFGHGEPWIWSYRAADWSALTSAHPQYGFLRAQGCETSGP